MMSGNSNHHVFSAGAWSCWRVYRKHSGGFHLGRIRHPYAVNHCGIHRVSYPRFGMASAHGATMGLCAPLTRYAVRRCSIRTTLVSASCSWPRAGRCLGGATSGWQLVISFALDATNAAQGAGVAPELRALGNAVSKDASSRLMREGFSAVRHAEFSDLSGEMVDRKHRHAVNRSSVPDRRVRMNRSYVRFSLKGGS